MKNALIVTVTALLLLTACDRRYLNIDFFIPELSQIQRDYPELLLSTNGFKGIDGDYDISYEMFSCQTDRTPSEIHSYYSGITNWSVIGQTTNVLVLARYSSDRQGITQAWIGLGRDERVVVATLSRRVPAGAKRLEDSKWKFLAERIESKLLKQTKEEQVQPSVADYRRQGAPQPEP